MALPREVTAEEDGNLVTGPVKTVIADVFSALPSFSLAKIELEAVGGTATKLLDKVNCERPYMITFNIRSAAAASFGLMFDVDLDLKGCYLRFVSTFDHRYTASLALAPAPLDDFWLDQYQLYLPRGVDGSEIVQHENIRIDGPVTILRSGDTIEVFVGGRALSYRLLGSASAAKKDDCKSWDIGMYVKDGAVQYSDFQVTKGMDY
jgi:beta-fructofuranosidase